MYRRPTDVEGFHQTLTSYAGNDMVATLNIPGKGPLVFGNLSSISYSVYRAKYPVLALGRVTPKGFTRGMRTVSGIMQFTDFDETIVYRCLEEIREMGYKVLMDEMPMFDVTISMANEFGSKSKMTIYGITTYTEGKVMGINSMFTESVYEFYALDIDPLTRVDRLGG
jgi:hypothetical protein